MAEEILSFYESRADHYHLIFNDWNKAIERQATTLNPLLVSGIFGRRLKVLDCACGIGTQAIGFASFGHQAVGADISRAEVTRAKREADLRSLDISFHVSDMTSLAEIADTGFDVVAALDNALPHLTVDQLGKTVQAMGSKLKSNGLFMASIRDYDELILQRPTIQEPSFYGSGNERRLVHQVWEWIEDRKYVVHLYLTTLSGGEWKTLHFVSECRSLLRNELTTVLESAGFEEVRWLTPAESGFYQPIVLARWRPGVTEKSDR
jgi:SAM-dependent methyltransferase